MEQNNNMESLRNTANQIQNNKAVAIKGTIDNIHDDLVVNVENAKLPEGVFAEHFLDHFKGNSNLDDALSLKWITLSGSPFNSVDIIDNKGDYLFSVPPLLAHPNLDDKPVSGMDFNAMTKEYALRSNRLQVDGDNFLNNQLSGIDKQFSSPEVEKLRHDWECVFKRYDKDSAKTKETPHLSNMMDDLIVYD